MAGPPWVSQQVSLERATQLTSLALARRHAENRLVHAALARHLTGRPQPGRCSSTSPRDGGGLGRLRSAAVLYLDLDGFKQVNDTEGHAVGDELLKLVASERISANVRPDDLVARLGGDEFAVVCTELAGSPEEAETVAERRWPRSASRSRIDGRDGAGRAQHRRGPGRGRRDRRRADDRGRARSRRPTPPSTRPSRPARAATAWRSRSPDGLRDGTETRTCSIVGRMTMPADVGIIDLMLGIPDGPKKDWYEFLKPLVRDHESQDEFEFPAQYMFKEVPEDPHTDDNVAYVLGQMDRYSIDTGHDRLRHRGRQRPGRCASTPTASSPRSASTPTGAWTRCATSSGPWSTAGPSAPRSSPPAATRRCRSTTSGCTRSTPSASSSTSRSSCCVGVPGPRVPMALPAHGAGRRGLLVLPRAQVRHPPRLRAVDRAGHEAHAQVAEPLLLDQRLRPEATTPRPSSTTPTPAAPTRSCTPATSRWA